MDLLYSGTAISKDGYINMLEELEKHRFPSLKFISKEFKPPTYIHKHPRHTKEIWKTALKSDRVQWIVRQISRNENKPKEEILKQAEGILKEMAFTDHMSLVRTLGFALFNVQRSIYKDGVFINVEAVEKIRSILQQHPVVFMPSHRSYMDFLMLSIVCFYLDLPLPAIAAGMDFKSMAVISTLLRSSGAFFMRRSFGSDQLYWALFTEYVHTILINGDRPMEFFIEGTRSRVGKSLNPKFGLLSVISEPYLKAQTYDVMIVPVSISYDRLLEEKLYAYELLGVPKPKESTSGVFRAASILNDDYGSVHMHFGEAMSMRQYFGSHLDRSVHACYPRYMLDLSEDEQKSMKILAYKVLLKQQENMVCSPFCLIAAILCMHPNGMGLPELTEQLVWLKAVLNHCRVRLLWPAGSTKDVIANYLYRYRHIVNVTNANGQSNLSSDQWVAVPESNARFANRKKISTIDEKMQDDAANHIMLANYRNQLLCYLVRPAMVALCLQKLCLQDKDEKLFSSEVCLQDFVFLRQLFQKEFIFEPDRVQEDLMQGIDILIKCGVVTMKGNDSYQVENHASRLFTFLRLTFSRFLVSYWLTCQYILSSGGTHNHDKINGQIQQWIVGYLNDAGVQHEMLSLNLISNSVHALVNMGAIFIHKTKGQKLLNPLHSKLLQISLQIAPYIKLPAINESSSLSSIHSSESKL